MKKLILMTTTSFFISVLPSFTYADSKVVLNVSLSPVGSFQATSDKIRGEIVKNGDEFSSDKIVASISSFKTGIEMRDDHLKKHLNSEKHNRAILTELKAKNGKGSALLEVNGVKKPIDISYKIKDNNVISSFEVKNSDFSLPKANYAGVGVEDNVKVEVTLPYTDKNI